MKIYKSIVLLWSIFSFTCPQAAPEIRSWSTAKGARVLFAEAHELPMVDIRVVFDAASARDGDQPGIANLTNALLDQGAGGKNADEIARGFDRLGAELDNGAERDMAWLSLRSLTDKKLLQPSLELFGKVLTRPDFPEKDFKREQQRTLVQLQYQKQKPSSIVDKAFYRDLYKEHPYASPPTGTMESIQALSADALRAFYRRYYVARNATLVIVGDVTEEQARTMAAGLVDKLPEGKTPEPLPKVNELTAASEDFIEHPSTQSHVLMGDPGIYRGDPDYFPLYVGNHILGGSGLVSRISEEIREKRGLSYSAYSYFVPMRRKGPYLLGLQTRNDQRQEALQLLRDTLKEFRSKGPTQEELSAAIDNIVGGFPLRVSSNGKITEYLAVIGFYDLPLDYLQRFPEQVRSVTAEQIHDAFQRRIHPDRMVTVIVGARDKADPGS